MLCTRGAGVHAYRLVCACVCWTYPGDQAQVAHVRTLGEDDLLDGLLLLPLLVGQLLQLLCRQLAGPVVITSQQRRRAKAPTWRAARR